MSPDSPTADELRRMAQEKMLDGPECTCDDHAIARALLAALPVVEAARELRRVSTLSDGSHIGADECMFYALDAFDKVVPL